MRHIVLYLALGIMFPLTSSAGAIAHQYTSGFEGIAWGDTLADLVTKKPGGEHLFSQGGGHREYSVPDDAPMFGIARSHMRIYYFLDETGSVDSVSITFPYEQRTKLLGELTLSFGPYKQSFTRGISTYYMWPRDDGAGITVEATLDPAYGILRMGVLGPNSLLEKATSSDCVSPSKPKKTP